MPGRLEGPERAEAVRQCLVECLQVVGLSAHLPTVVDGATHVTPPMFTDARFLAITDHEVRLEISQSDRRDPGWDQRYPSLRAYVEFLVAESLGFSDLGYPYRHGDDLAAHMARKKALGLPYLQRMRDHLASERFLSVARDCALD